MSVQMPHNYIKQCLVFIAASLIVFLLLSVKLFDVSKKVSIRNLRLHERLQIDRYWFNEDPEANEEKFQIDQLLKIRNDLVRAKFRNRTERIKKVCEEERKVWPSSGIFKHRIISFLWSAEPHYKMLLCRTAKHGSTSWASHFVKIYTQGQEGGSQVLLKKIEQNEFKSNTEKNVVIRSITTPEHEYLSFFVCRNPVEKLLSVYKYMVDMASADSESFLERPDFPKGGTPPTWEKFIYLVATSTSNNYLGMMRPLVVGCGPCTYDYDAVVMMETYDQDSRDILEPSGLGWVSPVHANNHGSHSLQAGNVTKIFAKVSKSDIVTLLSKYKMDFKVCGYEETLEELTKLTT